MPFGLRQFTRLLFRKSFLSLMIFVDPVSMDFPFLAVTLNDHPRDFVVPRMLNLHPCLGKPKDGSAEFQQEVRQVGAAGWHVMVHVEVLPSGAWWSS